MCKNSHYQTQHYRLHLTTKVQLSVIIIICLEIRDGKIRVWAAMPTHMHTPQVNRNCVNEMLGSMF